MNNIQVKRFLNEYKKNLVHLFLVGCLFAGLPVNIYLVEKDRMNKNTLPINFSSYTEYTTKLIEIYRNRNQNSLVSALNQRISKSDFNFDISFDDMPPYNGTIESSLAIARYVREKVKDIPNEVKYEYILNHFRLTPQEYEFFDAMVNKEATPYSYRYEDAFAVVTNVHNRMCSYNLCNTIKGWSQKIDPDKIDTSHYIIPKSIDGDVTMIDHLIAANQYQPYGDMSYLNVLGQFDPESSQALLDALFVIDVAPYKMHPYLNFVGWGYDGLRYDNIKFVPYGNNFSKPLIKSDTIPLEERYYMNFVQSLDNYSKKLINSDFK